MELMERDKAMQQLTSEVMPARPCSRPQRETFPCCEASDWSCCHLQMQNLGQQLRALDRKSGHQHAEIVDLQTQLHAAQVNINMPKSWIQCNGECTGLAMCFATVFFFTVAIQGQMS